MDDGACHFFALSIEPNGGLRIWLRVLMKNADQKSGGVDAFRHGYCSDCALH